VFTRQGYAFCILPVSFCFLFSCSTGRERLFLD